MEHVGGVEEHLLHALALLAGEPGDPEALRRDLARAFPAALEIAAAGTPAAGEVLVDLGVRPDRDCALRRRAGARRGGAPKPRAAPTSDADARHRGDDRDDQEQ